MACSTSFAMLSFKFGIPVNLDDYRTDINRLPGILLRACPTGLRHPAIRILTIIQKSSIGSTSIDHLTRRASALPSRAVRK